MTVSGFMYMCDRRNRFGFCFYDFLNYILEFLLQLGLGFFFVFLLVCVRSKWRFKSGL